MLSPWAQELLRLCWELISLGIPEVLPKAVSFDVVEFAIPIIIFLYIIDPAFRDVQFVPWS